MATNGNGRTFGLILFMAGLIASLSAAYVFTSNYVLTTRIDSLEHRVDTRLERIEEKLDRALQPR